MKHNPLLKKVVLFVVWIYLTLSIFMVMPMEGHAMRHGRSSDHSVQHANFICAWMCAASSHVQSHGLTEDRGFKPALETASIDTEAIFLNKPVLALSIRPPPEALS